jgi:hypothetical protein
MADTSNSTTSKRCSSGDNCLHPDGCWLPATTEYFHQNGKTLRARCIVCQNAIRAIQRTNDPAKMERARQRAKQWNSDNPDRKRTNDRAWREANLGRKRVNNRRWYENNKVKVNTQAREWVKKNPDKRRIVARNWRIANPDKTGAASHRYHAQRRSLPATFTSEQWRRCLEWWNNTCAYCGAQQSAGHILEQEHVESVSMGGGYIALNIIPACRACNASKNNTPLKEWLAFRHAPSKTKAILERIEAYFEYVKGLSNEDI